MRLKFLLLLAIFFVGCDACSDDECSGRSDCFVDEMCTDGRCVRTIDGEGDVDHDIPDSASPDSGPLGLDTESPDSGSPGRDSSLPNADSGDDQDTPDATISIPTTSCVVDLFTAC